MRSYILIIDDDIDVIGTLTRLLERQNYEVTGVTSGEAGLDMIRNRLPDLLILDIIMPEMSGLDVCRKLRSDDTYNWMPILFLSARNSTDDIVEGLDLGADDYITKPFEITELNARLRSLLRRAQRENPNARTVITLGELSINSTTHEVITPKKTTQLTATEHRLLRFFMEHPEEALSPSVLLQEVWSYPSDAGDPDLVRAHVRNLRNKIETNPKSPQYLRTIHGVGYIMTNAGTN